MDCDCPAVFVNILTRTIDCVNCGKCWALTWICFELHTALSMATTMIVSSLLQLHDRYRASRIQSLGIGLRDQYQRTGQLVHLDQSIQYSQQAIDATADDHPDRARQLQSLGAGLHDRYQRTGQADDLDQAIQYYQQAIDATPDDHPDRAKRSQSLGAGLHDRYQTTGQITLVCDNFFTTHKLFAELRHQGIGAYGTAKSGSGMPAQQVLLRECTDKATDYGLMVNSAFDGVNHVTFVDQKAVHMMTTVHDVKNEELHCVMHAPGGMRALLAVVKLQVVRSFLILNYHTTITRV